MDLPNGEKTCGEKIENVRRMVAGKKRADAGQTAKEKSLFGSDKTRIADFGKGKRKREIGLSKKRQCSRRK